MSAVWWRVISRGGRFLTGCSVSQQLLGGADGHNVWQLFANRATVNTMVQQARKKMKEGSRTIECLEKWLLTYFENDEKVCWRNGESLSLALYYLDQDWFFNLR